jgi:threonine dehydrogenase-like Zn-dependent dehydrogenase
VFTAGSSTGAVGAAFAKGLTLLDRIEGSDIDQAFVITHRASLDEAPGMYRTFRDTWDGCIKA